MTSTTLSARSSRAPTVSYTSSSGSGSSSSSAQPQQQQQQRHLHHHHHYHLEAALAAHPYSPTSHAFASSDDNLHAHRQSHNASKLPAFRFADLRKDRIALSSLQDPPTPLAPLLSQPSADRPTTAHITSPGLHHYSSFPERPVSIDPKQAGLAGLAGLSGIAAPSRTRSLKFDLASAAAARSTESLLAATRRPSSDDVSAARARLASVVAAPLRRRLTDSAAVASNQPPPPSPGDAPARPDDRRLRPLVAQTLSGQATDAAAPAAPVTLVAPTPSSARVSSIPSGRSSLESRRGTLSSEMPSRRTDDAHHGHGDAAHRVRRSLDSRRGGDSSPRFAPSEHGEMTTTTDNDNTADLFMKIAGEDSAPPTPDKASPVPESSSISRLFRSHRRPLSATVSSHETSQAGHGSRSRRLSSDQRESSRSRQSTTTDSQAGPPSREPSFRASTRTSLPQISTTESSGRAQPSGQTPQKPSPITPRQISFKESLSESASSYQRRRQSVTDVNNLSSSRAAQYRSANPSASQSRIYQSSPLVPKPANVLADGAQPNGDAGHMEGTESSSSTAAASVWDEVDDLKSRILRLEQKGKLSTASVAGPSDDRPRTATTAATTVSASPKRGSGPGSAHGEAGGSGSATRDSLLLSALSKTKDQVSPEVFSALELVATDALALSNMIPPAGQPGPISSRASTIGSSQGEGVTDRQLRKKAESLCRSLTELCLALADEANQKKQQAQPVAAAPRDEALLSPPAAAPAVSAARRSSAVAEAMVKGAASSRAPSSLGEKRKSMLASIAMPSARYATAPPTPMEPVSAGRKSSLLLSRIRRAAEEPEEQPPQTGRRSSLLLRSSRRSGSEDPEERPREGSRKTSTSLRSRKAVMSDSEDEPPRASRAPSRATTEVNGLRAAAGASSAQPAAADSATSPSVLPRRSRMIPAAIATRFATSLAAAGHHHGSSGSGSSVSATPARKYLERSSTAHLERTGSHGHGHGHGHGHERSNSAAHTALAERLAEERAQMQQRQQSALDRSALLSRSGSLGRRGRETGIPSLRG
ncbi:hypothetical protein VTJ83DRAFT_1089 [Remersonia thermophila]|uniref:Uncharacterized protein n=1 Tax=Remersonia thermophila TaxID=72144 RepID=A0ABR4DN32_9PEZI